MNSHFENLQKNNYKEFEKAKKEMEKQSQIGKEELVRLKESGEIGKSELKKNGFVQKIKTEKEFNEENPYNLSEEDLKKLGGRDSDDLYRDKRNQD